MVHNRTCVEQVKIEDKYLVEIGALVSTTDVYRSLRYLFKALGTASMDSVVPECASLSGPCPGRW
jgi:hypothetical protein